MRSIWLGTISLILASSTAASSQPSDPPEPAAYLERALTLLRQKHINSAKADWPAIEKAARARIAGARTTAETWPAIVDALQALGEKHSFLLEPPREQSPAAAAPQPAASAQDPSPTWQLLDGKFGVVRLPALNTLVGDGETAARRYAQAVSSGLQKMDAAPLCGWVVDLRENGGGNMWPMLKGLDPLLGGSPFGHFVLPANATMPWVRAFGNIFPSRDAVEPTPPAFALAHADAPLAILVGPHTASSGEMTAIALIGRMGVRSFGAPTAGFTTANEVNRLSDGAILMITATTVRDRTGKDYAGPIAPDEEVALSEAETTATDWLESQCRGTD
jgi:carboxyl-terminal processing protease